jgi:hypothetical protein
MVTRICEKCRRRNVVSFHVEPKEAWRTVVLNRWRAICAACFEAEAERVGVRYRFLAVGMNVVEHERRVGRQLQDLAGRQHRTGCLLARDR